MTAEQGGFYNNSIFWVEVDRISPNPYQPRKEFDEAKLKDLADSIRQYGVLQPLVVTRHEEQRGDGGLSVRYELIAGERRLRASKIAGLSQVPVTIRTGEEQGKVKLELAIIENLQREDLNPIDRARAFERLAKEFGHSRAEIGRKVGKSREYVSNTMRLLQLPEDMQHALSGGKITEGHSRALLMLIDRPEEQGTLFKDILYKRLTVRETEEVARRIAIDKVRKMKNLSPEIMELEQELTETLGTRVQIEQGDKGGRVVINYFSSDDLRGILTHFKETGEGSSAQSFFESVTNRQDAGKSDQEAEQKLGTPIFDEEQTGQTEQAESPSVIEKDETELLDDRSDDEKRDDEEELYSVKNFSI